MFPLPSKDIQLSAVKPLALMCLDFISLLPPDSRKNLFLLSRFDWWITYMVNELNLYCAFLVLLTTQCDCNSTNPTNPPTLYTYSRFLCDTGLSLYFTHDNICKAKLCVLGWKTTKCYFLSLLFGAGGSQRHLQKCFNEVSMQEPLNILRWHQKQKSEQKSWDLLLFFIHGLFNKYSKGITFW